MPVAFYAAWLPTELYASWDVDEVFTSSTICHAGAKAGSQWSVVCCPLAGQATQPLPQVVDRLSFHQSDRIADQSEVGHLAGLG